MKTPETPPVPDAGKKAPNRLDRLKKAVRGTIIKWGLIILLIFACAAIGTAWVIGEINVTAAVKKAEAEKRVKTAADEADKPTKPPIADAPKSTPTEEEADKKEEAPVDIAKLKETLRAELLDELKPAQPAPVEPTPTAPAVELDPDRAELTTMEREELDRLKKAEANFDALAREKAQALVAAEREKLQKDADEAFPGTARIITEDLDEKKHKRNTVDKVQGLKTFRVEGELPKFKVATESRDVPVMDEETKKIKVYHEVYAVLSTDGRPLVLDTTPELEGTDKVPFQLNTVGSQGAKKTWWVK